MQKSCGKIWPKRSSGSPRSTNESDSYSGDSITAPTESNYWTRPDNFTLSLQDLCHKRTHGCCCCWRDSFFPPLLSRHFPKTAARNLNGWSNMGDNQRWILTFSLWQSSQQTPPQPWNILPSNLHWKPWVRLKLCCALQCWLKLDKIGNISGTTCISFVTMMEISTLLAKVWLQYWVNTFTKCALQAEILLQCGQRACMSRWHVHWSS